jgi:hypothetical protein
LLADRNTLIYGGLSEDVREFRIDNGNERTIHACNKQGAISDIDFSDDGRWLMYHQTLIGNDQSGGVHLLQLD